MLKSIVAIAALSSIAIVNSDANAECYVYSLQAGNVPAISTQYFRAPAGATCAFPGPLRETTTSSATTDISWTPPNGTIVECNGRFVPFVRALSSVGSVPIGGNTYIVPGTVSLSSDGILQFSGNYRTSFQSSQCQPGDTRIHTGSIQGRLDLRTRQYSRERRARNETDTGRILIIDSVITRGLAPQTTRAPTQLSRMAYFEDSRDTTALVNRVVADGITTISLVFRSADPSPAQLTVTVPAFPSFRNAISVADQTFSLSSANSAALPYEARISFTVAAPGWQNGTFPVADFSITQGGQTSVTSLELAAPPVIAIHGLWSEPATWERIQELRGYLPVADIALIDYQRFNHLGFTTPQVQDAVSAQIAAARAKLRQSGVAFTQFNVVGHSMGALVARAYANSRGYRSAHNGWRGDFGLLVSVGSPMSGSPLAQELHQRAQTLFPLCGNGACGLLYQLMCAASPACASGQSSLAFILRAIGMPIDCDLGQDCAAVQALSPGSAPLQAGLASSQVLPYVGIRGVAPDSSAEERTLNAILLPITQSTLDMLFMSTANGHPAHPNHDTIVGFLSQNSGASQQRDIAGIFHAPVPNLFGRTPTETNSPEVMQATACYLGSATACVTPTIQEAQKQAVNSALLDEVLGIDLSARSEVLSGGLTHTFNNPQIQIGESNRLTIAAASGSIERVFMQVDAGLLFSVSGSPAVVTFTPLSTSFSASGVALLSGSRFARFRIAAPVSLPSSPPLDMQVEPKTALLEPGMSIPITVRALYPTTAADVSRLVTATWVGAGTAPVNLADGILAASFPGTGILRVHFAGVTQDVSVEVVDNDRMFGNGFEGQ